MGNKGIPIHVSHLKYWTQKFREAYLLFFIFTAQTSKCCIFQLFNFYFELLQNFCSCWIKLGKCNEFWGTQWDCTYYVTIDWSHWLFPMCFGVVPYTVTVLIYYKLSFELQSIFKLSCVVLSMIHWSINKLCQNKKYYWVIQNIENHKKHLMKNWLWTFTFLLFVCPHCLHQCNSIESMNFVNQIMNKKKRSSNLKQKMVRHFTKFNLLWWNIIHSFVLNYWCPDGVTCCSCWTGSMMFQNDKNIANIQNNKF